jgi:hypothetical protein
MNVVHIGSGSEYFEIRLPSSYSSEGWAQAEVEVSVHCFQGTIRPWVEAADFERFATQLRVLYDSLQGEAVFAPVEQQVVLKVTGTTGGHIHITGEAWSQATYENRLTFTIELDQSYLQAPLQELERIVASRAERAA